LIGLVVSDGIGLKWCSAGYG